MIRNAKNVILISVLALLLCGCGMKEQTIQPMAEATPIGAAFETVENVTSNEGKAEISELMSKNKATVMADDGSFPDWIEIHNLTDEPLELENWRLSDSAEDGGMILKGYIEPQSYAAFFTTGFNLSEGETAYLIDPNGKIIDSMEIVEDKSDISLTKDGPSKYPTPGYENTKEAFALLQSQKTVAGPLVINEVSVENFKYFYTNDKIEFTDWIEVKNISGESINLSDYYISDNLADLTQYNFKSIILSPGQVATILCDKVAPNYAGSYYMAPFSLNSENDRLYISDRNGTIIDYTSLKDIPCGGTYGRMDGENGFFYFADPTPGESNRNGKRFVSDKPASTTAEGIYNNVDSVSVELSGKGKIYYTLDGKLPTTASQVYTKPIKLDKTTIVRSICLEDNGLESPALTQSFFINENHTLPVASVVTDDKDTFYGLFNNGYRGFETPGVLSYFDENGGFTIGAGIKLHGDTSLLLAKKNLSFRFRGCYGAEQLNYDIFGEGVDHFTNLLLRAGQEQNNTIVRGEACTNLLKEYSDSVIYQRSRYCIVYVDGKYNGIYSIKDKLNEQMYADLIGVSKGSVEMDEATVYGDETFYKEVLTPVYNNSMSNDEAFAEATKHLNLQSLIDWTLLEGWTGNYDLAEGNLRYVKSTEYDDKWSLCLYDLDCAFADTSYVMDFVITYPNQVGALNFSLLKNAGFRKMMLERASEVYGKALTDDKIIEQLELLADEVRPEVERDSKVSGLGLEQLNTHLETLEDKIREMQWTDVAVAKLCRIVSATEEEKYQYFPDFYS